MKTLLWILAGFTLAIAIWLLVSGILMVVIGAIGHIFNINNFKLLSYWEVFILAIIFSSGTSIASSSSR